MKRTLSVLVLVTGMVLVSGCASDSPTYEEVRAETDAVLTRVANLVPDPKEIAPNDDFEPYPCHDPLVLGTGRGSFYTGQWLIFVDDSFDIPAFIATFPDALGERWQKKDLGIDVSFPQVYMVHESPRMSLSVEETVADGRKAVELLAISRCGIVNGDSKR